MIDIYSPILAGGVAPGALAAPLRLRSQAVGRRQVRVVRHRAALARLRPSRPARGLVAAGVADVLAHIRGEVALHRLEYSTIGERHTAQQTTTTLAFFATVPSGLQKSACLL